MASHLHLPFQDSWTRARNLYFEDLTHEEKQLYMKATAETIFYDASAAEKRHGAKSTCRGLMHKLQPFIAAIEQYGQALDVYSNAYSLALCPLWGSIRVILLIAREFGKYFEKLVDMFARIGDVLPQFHVYEKLFPSHERLAHALTLAYVDIIAFCSDAKAIFRRGQRASLISLKVGFKLIWKPFESQFGQQLDRFRNHRKNVEKEAGLSHMVEAADARALALTNHLEVERAKKENEHRRMIAIIESVDVEAKHRKLQNLRFHETCDWMLQNDKYLEWKHESGPSYLCCYGIPGSGKSMLASRIVDDISTTTASSQATLVYYYCDYADQRTLQTDRILSTMLKQLLLGNQISKAIESQVLRAYRDGQGTPATHEIVDLICSLMQLRPLAYIVLDGLDECEKQPRQDLLSLLKRLSDLENASVRIFISCRDEDQLLRSLRSYPRIQLTAEALERDMKSFVEGSVRSRVESGQLTIQNPDLEHHVVQELVKKAHGMFLWVFFQLDDLCEALSDAMIRQTLRDLPVGLVQTYERILMKISKGPLPKQEIALRVFRWTVGSRRPLKAEELQEAVAFDRSDTSWDRDKIPDENLMIETCRGLLVRDKEDRTVRFAHHTVQQYLLSAPEIRTLGGSGFLVSPRSEAEAYVGQVCVAYLCFSDFETTVSLRTPNVPVEPLGVLKAGGPVRIPTVLGLRKSLLEIPYRFLGGKSITRPLDVDYSKYLTPKTLKKPQAPSTLTEKYQLLDYIVEYWMYHTKELDPALDTKFRHLVLYKTLSFEFRPWGPNKHFGPYGCVSCPDPTKAKDLPLMSLFHYAAHVGHWSLMKGLVTEYCHHESPSNETLLIACRQGHYLVVQSLMHKINYDISDGRAIDIVAAAGYTDILKYFLDLSESSAKEGRSASSYNIIANASTLLNLAATNGYEHMVDLIFSYCDCEEAVYINGVDERTSRTALFSAVMSGHETMVRILLAKGAKLGGLESTAFHIAAEHGYKDILWILLKAAAGIEDPKNDFGVSDPQGIEMLRYIQYLLCFLDAEGEIPLHKAARNGHSAVVELIIDYQISLDIRSGGSETRFGGHTGLTAIHFAAIGTHIDVLKLLVDSGASINMKTNSMSWTALHFAAAEGHTAMAEWLIEKGADPNASAIRTQPGLENTRNAIPHGSISPLHLAVDMGHEGVVRVFMKLDLEKFGQCAHVIHMSDFIESAANRNNKAIVRMLVDWVGASGEESLEYVIEESKVLRNRAALEALESLSGERLWERDTEIQGWLAKFRNRKLQKEVQSV